MFNTVSDVLVFNDGSVSIWLQFKMRTFFNFYINFIEHLYIAVFFIQVFTYIQNIYIKIFRMIAWLSTENMARAGEVLVVISSGRVVARSRSLAPSARTTLSGIIVPQSPKSEPRQVGHGNSRSVRLTVFDDEEQKSRKYEAANSDQT